MTTPFVVLIDLEAEGEAVIEEILPQDYRQPATPITTAGYNERLDLIARRVYGTNHSVALRLLIWNNDLTFQQLMDVIPEGTVINTPPMESVYYTLEQHRIGASP